MTSPGKTTSLLPLYDVGFKSNKSKKTNKIMGDPNTFRFGGGIRVRVTEPMKNREKLLRYPGVDNILNNSGIRKEPLIPYEDGEIRLNPDDYQQRWERKTEVDENLLNGLVNRICLAAAMDVAGETEGYGIMNPYDGHVTNPASIVSALEKSRRSKRDKMGDKKGKKGKKEKRWKMVEEYLTDNIEQPTVPSVVIPLKDFRNLVRSEVESKARVIHDFYMMQWDHMQDDRIDAYRSLLMWKDQYEQVDVTLGKVKFELEKVKNSRDTLLNEIESIKKSKRRRSGAKRRRSREQAVRSQSSAQAQESEFTASCDLDQSLSGDEDCTR